MALGQAKKIGQHQSGFISHNSRFRRGIRVRVEIGKCERMRNTPRDLALKGVVPEMKFQIGWPVAALNKPVTLVSGPSRSFHRSVGPLKAKRIRRSKTAVGWHARARGRAGGRRQEPYFERDVSGYLLSDGASSGVS